MIPNKIVADYSQFGPSLQRQMEYGVLEMELPSDFGTPENISNADGGGGWIGAIGNAVGGIAQGIGGALSAKSQAKADIANSKAAISIAKENRTAELSHTTQDLIKANEEKQRNKQRTQIILLVVVVLFIAIGAFVLTKEDKQKP